MGRLAWDESLALGVKLVDEQHQELIRIVNLVLDAIDDHRVDDKRIGELLSWLREYTVFHFNAEEEFMSEIRYPHRGEHTQRHQELKKQIKEFQYSRFHHENVTTEEIGELLKRWLFNHILEEDLQIVQFLDEKKRTSQATS